MPLLRRQGHSWAARVRHVRLVLTLPHRKKVEPREVPQATFYVEQAPVVRVCSFCAGAPGGAGFSSGGPANTGVGTGSPGPARRLWLRWVYREQPFLDHRSP